MNSEFQVHLVTEDAHRKAEQLNRLLDTLSDAQQQLYACEHRVVGRCHICGKWTATPGRIEFASAGATRKR